MAGRTYGGGTPSTLNPSFWGTGTPWIQSSNVPEDCYFDIDISKYVTSVGIDNSAAQIVPGGSIAVVTHVGVGKLSYLHFPYATSQDFVSLAELKANAQFLCYSLGRRLKTDLNKVQGSAIKGITKDGLLSKQLLIPSLPEQRRIGMLFFAIDNLITLHQRKSVAEIIEKITVRNRSFGIKIGPAKRNLGANLFQIRRNC